METGIPATPRLYPSPTGTDMQQSQTPRPELDRLCSHPISRILLVAERMDQTSELARNHRPRTVDLSMGPPSVHMQCSIPGRVLCD